MITLKDKDGRNLLAADDEILQDGARISVPLIMMDSAPVYVHDGMGNAAGHKPGYCFVDDQEMYRLREETRAEQIDQLTNAWRHSSPLPPAKDGLTDEQSYEQWLTNAWRRP